MHAMNITTDNEYHPPFLFIDDGMLIKNISLPSVSLYYRCYFPYYVSQNDFKHCCTLIVGDPSLYPLQLSHFCQLSYYVNLIAEQSMILTLLQDSLPARLLT